MRISARNQLPGTVTSVLHGSVMSTVTIRLDGGQEIVSAITKDSAEGLALAEGDQVIVSGGSASNANTTNAAQKSQRGPRGPF